MAHLRSICGTLYHNYTGSPAPESELWFRPYIPECLKENLRASEFHAGVEGCKSHGRKKNNS